MIQIERVTKKFGNFTAVEDLSLTVAEGETVVLLGTSGCGKTTTLRMVNRLTEASSGIIKVNGVDIKKQQPQLLRRNIGYVLQHHGLFPHYTVAQNIAIVPELLKWEKSKIKEQVDNLLEKLRLPLKVADKYPSELSGGQQQRVGLARALAANPPVLLMDEPFGALDTVTRSQVREEFASLDELKRKTILMVTHDVREAIELGDRICIMDKGKIVQAGKPSELLMNPVNAFVSSFLAEDRLRFMLETISIKDVWKFLPRASGKVGAIQMNTQYNLWHAMEVMSFKEDNGESYFGLLESETKSINPAILMSAFFDFKRQIHG